MSDEPWQLADKVEGWVYQEFTSYIGKRQGLVALLADALAQARREGAAEVVARVEAVMQPGCFGGIREIDPFALDAALLLAGVALKRADQRHADFVDDSHVPLHQEDR